MTAGRPVLRLGVGLALVLAPPALPQARAADAPAALPGLTLSYDPAVWTLRPAVPPVDLALACAPAVCGRDALLTLVADPLAPPGPGAGAFTPGAVASAFLQIRVQALMPGLRLLAVDGAEPALFAGRSGYRARYDIEDRTLARSQALVAIVPAKGGALHLRLLAPRLEPGAAAAFGALVGGLAPPGR